MTLVWWPGISAAILPDVTPETLDVAGLDYLQVWHRTVAGVVSANLMSLESILAHL